MPTNLKTLLLASALTASALASALANIPKPTDQSNPDTLYAEAAAAFGKGDYAKALELSEELAEKEGASKRQIELKTEILLETGKYADAEKILTEGKSPAPPVLLARAESARGEYVKAMLRLKKRLAREPADFKARKLIVELARKTGDLREVAIQRRLMLNIIRSEQAKSIDILLAAAVALEKRSPSIALQLAEEAVQLSPDTPGPHIEAGKICLDNFAWPKATRHFKAALAKNPKNPDALLGMAWLAFYNGDINGTLRNARTALETNPNLVKALITIANAKIVINELKKAKRPLEKAETVNPNDPELLATLAAYYDTIGDKAKRDEHLERAKKINPYDPEPLNTVADLAQAKNKPEHAAKWARKAIETAPSDWRGHYLLGTSLVRLGEEKAGYDEIETSFELNPFNIFAYNILQALDQDFKRHRFEKFVTEHFVVKIPKEDANTIWPEMESLVEKTYARITEKYGFEPKGPKEHDGKILVVITPDHESFSARTIGLPGIQASGVCFGQVLLMPSPRQYCLGKGPGLDWKSVFEHEFNHIETVQQSEYNIPRWFTEGLSVWEERDTHPTWATFLAKSLKRRGALLTLEKFDSGFILPSYPLEVAVSYYQAGLACQHISEKYGFDKIIDMIKLAAEGKTTAEFAEKALGKPIGEINAELDKLYTRTMEKRLLATDNARKKLENIWRELEPDQKKQVPESFEWKPMLDKLLKKNDTETAEKLLRALLVFDDSDYHIHQELGNVEMKLERWKQAAEAFSKAMDRNPFDKKIRESRAKALGKIDNGDAARSPGKKDSAKKP
jgi:tetratricopeptide (TPR) repeat protein